MIHLCEWIAGNWEDLDGTLMLKGVDLRRLPFDRALNVTHSLLVSTAKDDKDRYKIDTALHKPLPGRKHSKPQGGVDDLWDHAASDGAAFMAAFQNQTQVFGAGSK